MKIHLICREGGGLKVTTFPQYESRAWDIPETDAQQLKLAQGMIHFHESKSVPSYFGGAITDYEVIETDAKHSKRIVLKLTSTENGRGKAWAGRSDTNAWYSGLTE
jgi:hypothetical protein